MTRGPTLDPYVIETLMADLVRHDRRPSAFLVYLALASQAGEGGRVATSHAHLAERTGLSKRVVQDAVRHLVRRGLLQATRGGPTEIATYTPLSPWRREA